MPDLRKINNEIKSFINEANFVSNKCRNKLLKILFCLGIVALIAITWEVFEFSIDSFAHTNLQHNQDTGVIDTMQDMIVATLGGIISSIYMWIKK